MKQTYLKNVVTLELDAERCIGCGQCINVCPHNVFEMAGDKVRLINRDGCMECGACALNCPVEALESQRRRRLCRRNHSGLADGQRAQLLLNQKDRKAIFLISATNNEQRTVAVI